MTVIELTLFDAPPTQGSARRNDRPTSVAAAKAKDPSPDMGRVMHALDASGGEGTIDDVQSFINDRDRGCLSRRITDCVEAGLLRDTGRTERGSRGRQVIVWEVVA